MAVEAKILDGSPVMTAAGALEPGDVISYHDGCAAVVTAAYDKASSDDFVPTISGLIDVDMTDSQVVTKGQPLFWDVSANKATVIPAASDFFLGTSDEDLATGTSRKVRVWLNKKPQYMGGCGAFGGIHTDLPIIQEVLGLGVDVLPGGTVILEFDNTNEAATASWLSGSSVLVTEKFLVDICMSIEDNGTSVLDIVAGIANDDHATDADSITESCFASFNGGSLVTNVESDDGTTERAAADASSNYVAGTPFLLTFDARSLSDIQVYKNGVLLLGGTVFTLAAATGPLKVLVQMEKTTSTETGKVAILWAGIRRVEDGAANA